MFDLKAKLLAHGLVTKEQINKVEKEKALPKNKAEQDFASFDRNKAMSQLQAVQKPEQYIIIRKWVDINRFDKPSLVSLDCEKFFINTKDKQVTWLTLPKEVINKITSGEAGVVAYMSNHGLTHAVVPREIAEDISQVFPDWLKVLNEKI